MKTKSLFRAATACCMAAVIAFTPADALAATLLRRGSSGTEVKSVQLSLKELGYFTYPKVTGYYGSITETAVKKFQRDNNLKADGVVGSNTRAALKALASDDEDAKLMMEPADTSKMGDLDWFSEVQYIFKRGDTAKITDVDTGRSFMLKRTFGTNHADVEPLTREDAGIIKDIWGGWSWTRRAVIVEIDGYIIAGSLAAMPHAGVDSAPAVKYVSNRSGGYGWGKNLDAVKGNGVNGVIDLHFKNSRNHNTNKVKKEHQDMVKKANIFIENNYK